MAMFAMCFVMALHLCSAAGTSSSAAAWETRSLELLQDGTKSPVEKVAQLLTDMSKQLEEDAKSDEEVNEGMNCWCKTNKADKTKTIKENTEKVADLHASIKQLTAKSNGLNNALDALTSKLESDQKELDTAVELRKKETDEFNAAESSTAASIKSLDGASDALKQGMQHSMLQQSDEGVNVDLSPDSRVAMELRKAVHHHDPSSLLWSIHDAAEKRILEKLMEQTQAEDISLIQTSAWSLNAPFDVIHGAIQSMQDTFEANLKSLQDKETTNSAVHAAMKVAKQEEIKEAMSMIDNKREILADTDEKNVAQKEDLHDTNKALEVDREYLQNVNEQCALHEKEYAQRLKTRQEELGAVNGALDVLTNDEAKDLFTSTLGHSKGGEKLGSRDNEGVQEWKEDRDVKSKRSQLNAARKKRYGTVQRGVVFLQEKAIQQGVATKHDLPDFERLKTLEKRSEAYWKAHFSMASLKQPSSTSQEGSIPTDSPKLAHHHHHHHHHPKPPASPQRSLRHNLGLTAEKAMIEAMEPSLKDKVFQMKEDLMLQQGEETAKYDWCVNERIDLEKKNSTQDRMVDRARTSLKTLNKELHELKVERKDLMNEQADADVELQLASNGRKKDNAAYQKSTMNQIATQKVLKKALQFLQDFYKKKAAAAFLEESTEALTSDNSRSVSTAASAAAVASSAMLDESEQNDDYDYKDEDAMDVNRDILREGKIANLRIHRHELITKPAPSVEEIRDAAAVQSALVDSWLQRYDASPANSPVSFLRTQRQDHVPEEAPANLVKEAEEEKADAEKSVQNALSASWLQDYSESPANSPVSFLQTQRQTHVPEEATAKLLKEAEEENADAQKSFAAARAMLRRQHQTMMIQQSAGKPAGPPPPAGFKSYEGNRASGGVLVMIQNLIDESEAMVKEASADETDGLTEYEKFVKETNDVTHERQKAIVNRNARIGKVEGFIAEAKMALKEALDEKARLRQRDIDLHGECDFLVKNYVDRKEARTQEIQNLIMAGPMINNMAGEFDDNAVLSEKGGGVAGVVGAPNAEQKDLMSDAFLKNAAAKGKADALPDEALAAAEALDAAKANRVQFEATPEGLEIDGKGERAILKMP